MKKAHVAMRALAAILVAALLAGCPEPEAVVFTETQYERYVEHYDAETGALESWVYDSDDSLAEYTDFVYDENGFNTELWVYNSDQVMDSTTLVSKILYDYDESGNVTHAELWSTVDGALTKYATYDATYNAQGNYLDYVERDGDDAVIEHRVCTYDGTGENYLTETYYSDAGTANKVEEYRCTYDSVDASKWIREDHYIVIGAESSDATNDDSDYTRTMVYTFTWDDSDNMYLQSDFDETGAMVMAIMYTFDGDGPKTRSCFDEDGMLDLYRTYEYDGDGELIELCYYNYNNDAGNELEVRETYRLYTDDGEDMYEQVVYTYNYASRSLTGRDSGLSASGVRKPQTSHHRVD